MDNHPSPQRTFNYASTAVILAAGAGERLRSGNGGIPKPLTPLLGQTLLERAILACRAVGIGDYYVVVGSCGEEVASYAEGLGERLGVSIRAIRNQNWAEGNGTSALAVSRYLSGPCILLMCDHIFDVGALRLLLEAAQRTKACLLVVDRRVDRIFDIEDATKVKLDGLCITDIGKDIDLFDAVDTGLFLCQPILFEALKKTISSGDGSLSAGIRELIQRGQIQAVDIENHFWHDVDAPASLAHAKRLLLDHLSKPSEDGFIAHYLNRPISRRISGLLAYTSVTPNAITVLSFFIALFGASLFSLGEQLWTLLGGILVQLASIVDGCDGEIARLKFQPSRYGAWFDTVLDRYADVALAAAISYGYWLSHPQPTTWLVGIVASTGFILTSYTGKEYALRYGKELPNSFLRKLLKRDMRLFALFVGALLNRPFEVLVLVGLVSHLGVGWILLSTYRAEKAAIVHWSRKDKASDPQ